MKMLSAKTPILGTKKKGVNRGKKNSPPYFRFRFVIRIVLFKFDDSISDSDLAALVF